MAAPQHPQPPAGGKTPGRTLGQGMLLGSWVVGMAAATWLFSDHMASRNNPNQDPLTTISGNVVEVVLERNKAEHYVATGSINGETVTFLLDTGATDVVVPGRLADRLGLHRGQPMLARTANGTVEIYRTELASLGLGGILLQDVRAAVNPAMQGPEVLLGMSALANLELRQQGRGLTLRQENR